MLEEHTTRHIAAFVRSHLALQPTAGISVGITDRHQTLFSWSYGFANLEAQLPLTPAHLLQIGSIGKSFTSLILMQLYEEGRFNPQAPIQSYLPWLEIRNGGEAVTGHHLLTHTGGLIQGSDESITAFGEAWALRDIPAGRPGERFHYSNTGYKILGLVIERLTVETYGEVVRKRILNPLGMDSTEPTITHQNYPRHARGYEPFPPDRPIVRPFKDKTWLSPAPWLETATADGCITSTPGDMATYVRALMNGFDSLIKPETYALMTKPHAANPEDGEEMQYGYGLDVEQVEGALQIGHGGGMVGYTSHLLCRPDPGYGVIVLMNGPGKAGTVARFVLSSLIADARGVPLPELPAPVDHYAIPDELDLAGDYHGTTRSIRIEKRNGGLGLEGIGPALALHTETLLHLDDPAWNRFFIRIRRGEDGSVKTLEHGGDVYYRDGKPPVQESPPIRWKAYPGEYVAHNPWYPSFCVVLRESALFILYPLEGEQPLTEIEPGLFRVGEEGAPETLKFDVIFDGLARRALHSGAVYNRK